jgi:hypothetical protein
MLIFFHIFHDQIFQANLISLLFTQIISTNAEQEFCWQLYAFPTEKLVKPGSGRSSTVIFFPPKKITQLQKMYFQNDDNYTVWIL